jgi:hypothetical protein
VAGHRILRPGESVRRIAASGFGLSLGLGNPQVSVFGDPPPPSGDGIPFCVWRTESQSFFTQYPWWNAGQATSMTPSNCRSILDGFAAAGRKCFVRLWSDATITDGNGNYQYSLYKSSIDRYKNAGLQTYLNSRGADGTILAHITIDDIKKVTRWGRELTGTDCEEQAEYSKQEYPSIRAWARARTTQLAGRTYDALEGCASIYLFNRGNAPGAGAAKPGGYTQQIRIDDCTKYRDDELEGATTLGLDVGFGLNIVNGGDGSSGLFGDDGTDTLYRQSANELTTYGGILIPDCDLYFQMWEYNPEAANVSYLARTDVQTAMNGLRTLCDAQ